MRSQYDTIASEENSSFPRPSQQDALVAISGRPEESCEVEPGAAESLPQYEFHRWCGVRRSTCLLFIYVCSYFCYLIGGAYLMVWLESDIETFLRQDTIELKRQFLLRNPSLNASDLEEFLEQILKSSQQGISVLDSEAYEEQWTLGQSFLFTVTVVTTIGYGHITPNTQGGKLICILYAVLGIPFTLVFLSAMVQRLLYPTCYLLKRLFRSQIANCISPFSLRLIHLIFLSIVFLLLFVFIPATIFYFLEQDWTYLDAIYFIFISLTTIGFGDYTPGGDFGSQFIKDIYHSCVAVYLLLGITFLSLTLTVYYDIPQLNLGLHLQKHKDIHILEDLPVETDASDRDETDRSRISARFASWIPFFRSCPAANDESKPFLTQQPGER